MSLSVFVELRFWVLVVFSVVLPAGIYAALLATRAISRMAVLGFGVALVLIAGVDVYLLQSLANVAKTTPSLADDAVFLSELSIALYVLPVVFGGIGSVMVTVLWSIFFPKLRNVNTLNAEELLKANAAFAESEPVD